MKPETRINAFTGKAQRHRELGSQPWSVCSTNTLGGEEKPNQFYMDFKANAEKLHLEGPELRWEHGAVQTRSAGRRLCYLSCSPLPIISEKNNSKTQSKAKVFQNKTHR